MIRKLKLCLLSILKKRVQEKMAKIIDETRLYGERITVNINGRQVAMRHHAGRGERPPVYFDFHGGGWTWGCIENGDLILHEISSRLGFECYSIDYPLVPDAFYPEPVFASYEVIDFMRRHSGEFRFDPECMVVGGRSAGGNLAAALCLLAKERGEFQFACQVLDHPATDASMTAVPDKERYNGEAAIGPFVLHLLSDGYATKAQQKEKYASPLLAPDEALRGLPPAVVLTCELDSVRLDGDRYAMRLEELGVPVIHRCFPGVIHGFTEEDTPEAAEGRRFLIEGIKKYVSAEEREVSL